MDLPFSKDQFFQVIADYNVAVWPAQFVLILLAIAIVVLIMREPRRAGRLVSLCLALLWGWTAVAYHLAFFWRINPAAPLFAAISIAAAAAFLWCGAVRGGLRFEKGLPIRAIAGLAGVYLLLRRGRSASPSAPPRRP